MTTTAVEVELEVGGKTLWARISPWAGMNWRSNRACGCTRKLKCVDNRLIKSGGYK